jgi:hypothetical protein
MRHEMWKRIAPEPQLAPVIFILFETGVNMQCTVSAQDIAILLSLRADGAHGASGVNRGHFTAWESWEWKKCTTEERSAAEIAACRDSKISSSPRSSFPPRCSQVTLNAACGCVKNNRYRAYHRHNR